MTSRISEGRAVVDGVRTRTLSVEGDGPTILLIHGFTDSADTWRPVLAELSAMGRRAVAVDLPNSGRAAATPDRWRLESLDAFTAAFVRAHAADGPVVLAGNSLGGWLAMRAAASGDLPLSAVAPISPGGLMTYGRRLERLERWVRRFARWLRGLDRLPIPARVVQRRFARMYQRRLSADAALARRYGSHIDGMRSVRRLLEAMLVISDGQRAQSLTLDAIRVPLLLIWGTRDDITPIDGAPLVLDAVPASRLIELDDCGHCAQVERPDDVAELLAGLPVSVARAEAAA